MGKKQETETDVPAESKATTPEERIEELEAQVAELEARSLRAQADYKNLRRRSLADLESSLQMHMQPLLDELMFVLDFLDMALASPAENPETKNLVLGVQMTRDRFASALENADVREIPTDGQFDPALHDAKETRVEPGAKPGEILSTVRRGFTWQGRVLRPAQVIVAASEESDSDEATPEDGSESSSVDPAESTTE